MIVILILESKLKITLPLFLPKLSHSELLSLFIDVTQLLRPLPGCGEAALAQPEYLASLECPPSPPFHSHPRRDHVWRHSPDTAQRRRKTQTMLYASGHQVTVQASTGATNAW